MNRKIRILAIGHSYVVALNRALLRQVAADPDFEVTVAAPNRFRSELGEIPFQPEPPGSPLRVVPMNIRLGRSIYIFGYDGHALNRLLANGGFDLVYAWEEPYIYAGFQIARAVARSAPKAVFCFRTAQSLPKRYPPPFNYFERVCLRRADGWVAGAHLVYENSVARGYPAAKGTILTLAVDTALFSPLPEDAKKQIREELGLNSPILGFVGRLTAAKGIEVIQRAVEMLEPSRPWSLLFLGSGPCEEDVLRWAGSRGWAGRIVVKLVEHSAVPRFLAAMDVLLAPSLTTRGWKEQFGRMVIEAFACGVPVIVSDSGELPFLVGDSGWVVPEGQAPALAEAIRAALDMPERREEAIRKGLERAKTYSTISLGRQFGDYYRKLVEQKRISLCAA